MASPRELAALVRLWLGRGAVDGRTLVSHAGLERTERSETNAIRGLDIDYGVGNYGGTFPSRERGHGGGIDGFLSAAQYLPARGVGYVVLLNSTGRGAAEANRQIRALVTEYLVGGRPAPPPAVDVPASELRPWVGAYHLANPRMQLFAFLQRLDGDFVVRFADGGLVVDDPIAKRPMKLVPLGGGRFRYEGVAGSHIALSRDAAGRRVFFNWGIYAVEEPAWWAPAFAGAARAIVWLLLSALALPIAAIVLWRQGGARVGWFWPALSAFSFFAVPVLFFRAAEAHALGERNPCTVGICALTMAFAAGAILGSLRALRGLGQPLPLVVRLHRLAVALAALSATVFFAYYRILGVRLWSY